MKHIAPGSSVLDIGCGRAALLDHVTPDRYVGVDRITEVIAMNRVRFPGYDFVQADIGREPLDALGHFDVVMMLAVIEHFARPDLILKKVTPLLARQGRIIVTMPHPSGEWLHGRGQRMGLCSAESNQEHHELLDKPALYQLADRCDLRIVCYRRFLLGLNQLIVFQPRHVPS